MVVYMVPPISKRKQQIGVIAVVMPVCDWEISPHILHKPSPQGQQLPLFYNTKKALFYETDVADDAQHTGKDGLTRLLM